MRESAIRIGAWAPNWAFNKEAAGLKKDIELIKHGVDSIANASFGICDKNDIDFDIVFSLESIMLPSLIEKIHKRGGIIIWCPNTELIGRVASNLERKHLVDLIAGKTQGQTDYLKSLDWDKPIVRLNFATILEEKPGNVERDSIIHFAGCSWMKNTKEQIIAGLKLVEEGHAERLIVKMSPSGKNKQVENLARKMHNMVKGHPNVEFIDKYISEEEKIALYHRSKLALCASTCEGFGHYILEAASFGCKVVTTDGIPMKELLDNNCWLAKSKKRNAGWGHRYSCKSDDIYLAALQALQEETTEEPNSNVNKRIDLFLEDFNDLIKGITNRLTQKTANETDTRFEQHSWEVLEI